MRRILLIGQDGMLGSELKEVLERDTQNMVEGTTLENLDICDREKVFQKIEEVKPDYIINCAAYTNVDACETNYELAKKVNGDAVKNIADACAKGQATLIHISTDYVFDGDLPIEQAYTEEMEIHPVSAYGRTKSLGEENAKKAQKYYILRTAWLYGLHGKNFVKTMLNLSETHEELKVVCDQHGSPTSTTTLCSIIAQIIEQQPVYGIYHSTNLGFTTWYDFTKAIFEIAKKNTRVLPVTSEEYGSKTKRPFNSQLEKNKLLQLGIQIPTWQEALEKYMEKEMEERKK